MTTTRKSDLDQFQINEQIQFIMISSNISKKKVKWHQQLVKKWKLFFGTWKLLFRNYLGNVCGNIDNRNIAMCQIILAQTVLKINNNNNE